MAVSEVLLALAGNWQGCNRLWLDPDEPAQESEGTAVLQPVAQNKFITLHYTWADEGQPQAGVLLLGQDGAQVNASWVDSWHMQDKIMQLTGTTKPDGSAVVDGSYAAPPGPDWGWRITIQPLENDQFKLIMHNVTPDGAAMLAVEAVFSRAG